MSRTLKLIDHLLARSQHLQECGRTSEALKVLKSVADFGDLPAKSVVEMQSRLAQIYLDQRRFKRAQKALELALQHDPNNAQLRFLQATAISSSNDPDHAKALDHYQRSLELQPDQPDCLAACGLLEIRLGWSQEGLEHCRRAAELAPDDAEVVRMVAKGLRLANQSEEARDLLLAARFRNSKNCRFQQLWTRHRFHRARREQQVSKTRFTVSRIAEEPVILSFAGCRDSEVLASKLPKTIRQDSSADLPAPRGILPVLRPDQRHAQ
jgi:tetratricopeptide (TPR) repeat protein